MLQCSSGISDIFLNKYFIIEIDDCRVGKFIRNLYFAQECYRRNLNSGLDFSSKVSKGGLPTY